MYFIIIFLYLAIQHISWPLVVFSPTHYYDKFIPQYGYSISRCMYICSDVFMCVCVCYVRMCVLMYVGVHMCIYVVVCYVCMCVLMYAGVHTCIYVVSLREWIICVCLDEDLIYRTSTKMLLCTSVDICVVICVVLHVCLNAYVY